MYRDAAGLSRCTHKGKAHAALCLLRIDGNAGNAVTDEAAFAFHAEGHLAGSVVHPGAGLVAYLHIHGNHVRSVGQRFYSVGLDCHLQVVGRTGCGRFVCGHHLAADERLGPERAGFIVSGIENIQRTAAARHHGGIEGRTFFPCLGAQQPAVAVEAYFLGIREHRDVMGGGGVLRSCVVGGNVHHGAFVEPGLRHRSVPHALQHVVAWLGIAVDVHHSAVHGLVLAAAGIVVVAP